MLNKLLIVSGADRVGKSTFCKSFRNAEVCHFGIPSSSDSHVFGMYLRKLKDSKSNLIFDRSWVCGYILEDFRRHSTNHILELTELEIQIHDLGWDVFHIGILRPWYWSAPKHLEEIRELYPDVAPWRQRDLLTERRLEHQFYQGQLQEYYTNVSLFPSIVVTTDQQINRARQNIQRWLDIDPPPS